MTVVDIGTTLVDSSDGDHVIVSIKVKLTDTIEYKASSLSRPPPYTAP